MADEFEMVILITKHTRFGNMKATFKRDPKSIALSVLMGTMYTELTRSRNKKPLLKDFLKL